MHICRQLDRQLRLYDVRLPQTELFSFGWKQESSESQSALINQSWSPDGLHISSGSSDPAIHIFDIRYNAASPSLSIKAHKKRVFKAEWHSSNQLLVSISSDLEIGIHKLWWKDFCIIKTTWVLQLCHMNEVGAIDWKVRLHHITHAGYKILIGSCVVSVQGLKTLACFNIFGSCTEDNSKIIVALSIHQFCRILRIFWQLGSSNLMPLIFNHFGL